MNLTLTPVGSEIGETWFPEEKWNSLQDSVKSSGARFRQIEINLREFAENRRIEEVISQIPECEEDMRNISTEINKICTQVEHLGELMNKVEWSKLENESHFPEIYRRHENGITSDTPGNPKYEYNQPRQTICEDMPFSYPMDTVSSYSESQDCQYPATPDIRKTLLYIPTTLEYDPDNLYVSPIHTPLAEEIKGNIAPFEEMNEDELQKKEAEHTDSEDSFIEKTPTTSPRMADTSKCYEQNSSEFACDCYSIAQSGDIIQLIIKFREQNNWEKCAGGLKWNIICPNCGLKLLSSHINQVLQNIYERQTLKGESMITEIETDILDVCELYMCYISGCKICKEKEKSWGKIFLKHNSTSLMEPINISPSICTFCSECLQIYFRRRVSNLLEESYNKKITLDTYKLSFNCPNCQAQLDTERQVAILFPREFQIYMDVLSKQQWGKPYSKYKQFDLCIFCGKPNFYKDPNSYQLIPLTAIYIGEKIRCSCSICQLCWTKKDKWNKVNEHYKHCYRYKQINNRLN